METKSKNVSEKQKVSADLAFEKVYSAYELGDLMNNNPLALMKLDLGVQTKWYDCDFIEQAMSFIQKEPDMLMFMTLIVQTWRAQTAQRLPHIAYRDPKTKQNVPYVSNLDDKLQEIHDRIMSDRKQLEEARSFRQLFFETYCKQHEETDFVTPPKETRKLFGSSSVVHSFKNESGNHSKISLDSLPDSVRSKILLSQDVFDVFVKQLNDDTWSIVNANKGSLCDALRFICIKRNIIARDTDRETFDSILHQIVFELKDTPSLLSSMKRRTDTSSNKLSRSIACYDSPIKRHQDEVWKLINDCKPLEESLQPVYEAMEKMISL